MRLDIRHTHGPDNWPDEGNSAARRDAIHELFCDFPERSEQLGEDGPWDRDICSEMVVLAGDKLVGTGMLVVDHDRADCPARIWGMAFDPAYRTDFLVFSLEEALLRAGAFEIEHDFIEGADGRLIANPYSDADALFDTVAALEI